jgi:membrane-associated protease RseP (regulator of RpoE activity)
MPGLVFGGDMVSSNRGAAWVWVCGFVIFLVAVLAFMTAPGSRGSFRRLTREVGDFIDKTQYTEWRWTDERGELRYTHQPNDHDEVEWNGKAIAPEDVLIENDTLTIFSVKDAAGDLLYDRVPLLEEADRRVRATDPERRLGVRFDALEESAAGRGPLRFRRVIAGEPAANAGLLEGDVLVAVDGQPAATTSDLRRELAPRVPGGTLRVTVRRGDVTRDLSIDLPSLLPLDDWRQLAEPH